MQHQQHDFLDPRWPLPCVDMVYVGRIGDDWALKDFNGEIIFQSSNRSSVFFKAAELKFTIHQRQ